MTCPVLLVMAAGMGSRYGGLKQIDPVGPGGEILLDYSLYDAIQVGFRKMVFVVSRAVKTDLQKRIEHTVGRSCETIFVIQDLNNLPHGYAVPAKRQKPWGTGHAVLTCRHLIESPFAVINADDLYGRRAIRSIYAHLWGVGRQTGADEYCLAAYRLGSTLTEQGSVARAICTIDKQGYLVEVVERKKIEQFEHAIKSLEDDGTWVALPADISISMNLWGFTPTIFAGLEVQFGHFLDTHRHDLSQPEFYLPQVVNSILKEGKVSIKALPTEDRWIGITYQADKPWVKTAVTRLIQDGVYPEHLWE